jgi:hypothetical protein
VSKPVPGGGTESEAGGGAGAEAGGRATARGAEADGVVTRQRAPSIADLRSWARAQGIPVPERGPLRREIREAWNVAHRP